MQKLAPLLFGLLMSMNGHVSAQAQDYIIQQHTATVSSRPGTHPTAATGAKAGAAAVPTGAPQRVKRIVLLLPTLSPALGDAAVVVQAGAEAAAKVDGVPVELEATHDDDVVEHYRNAVAHGATVVIGPLTREAITALAPRVSVPTLALNTLGREAANAPRLLGLSLSVESEARQVAQLMLQEGRTRPVILVGQDAIGQRMARAFADEWLRLSKQPALEQAWGDGAQLNAEAGQADAAFLAMDEAQAATVKPALPGDLACYGTSQINARNPSASLTGTKFLDMPWFLMPDHPAVRRYERPAAALTMQTERLYALGIDAFRVAQAMSNKMPPAGWQLDGVTGDLRLKRDRQFERELPVSIINGAKP